MKNRILIALAAVLVFGLAAVVFAYNNHSPNQGQMSASHCAMHKQNAATQAEHKDSCCGMADCCKDGECSMGGACCKKDSDSCPMKQQTAQTTTSVDMTNVVVVGDGENCCQTGADCCKDGSCCHKS
jgi:hypothetical protein